MAKASKGKPKTQLEENLTFGKLVEGIVSTALKGRAHWGAEGLSTYEPDLQKTIVCEAQVWSYVGDNREKWDYEVCCIGCKNCGNIVKQKHEVKGNKRTHIVTMSEKGQEQRRTQNIYIELWQWVKEKKKYVKGWWHEDNVDSRADWYHFYQPIEYIEEDKKYGNPERTDEIIVNAFREDVSISENDTLVTAAPWGYILSIKKDDLKRIISGLNPFKYYIENMDEPVAYFIAVDELLDKYRGKGVNYTPVFTEIQKAGETTTGGLSHRWIPETLYNKFVEVFKAKAGISELKFANIQAANTFAQIIFKYGLAQHFDIIGEKHSIPTQHHEGKVGYQLPHERNGDKGRPHYIRAFFDDISRMEVYRKGGKAQ